MKNSIFSPGKAEIGLGTAIFGISVKNYRGDRNSGPNPCSGDPFRDRLKMVVVVEGDGRWWWRVEVKGGGGRWWWKVEDGGGRWWWLQKTRLRTRSASRCPGMPSLFLQPP